MKWGTLYGIGVGPGDPELLTLKAARILSSCRVLFVPKGRHVSESMASNIAGRHIPPEAEVIELVFPMTRDPQARAAEWARSVDRVLQPLRRGQDACFITLGDPMLYSTFIYLLRSLRSQVRDLPVVVVPGITSPCAAAALAEFPLAESDEPVTLIPASSSLDAIRQAASMGGTLVLMKIGRHLREVLSLLKELGYAEETVFVSRVGQEGQRLVTDLDSLSEEGPEAGYFSIILARPKPNAPIRPA